LICRFAITLVRRVQVMCAWQDSNLRHLPPEGSALIR
jgi:hypothetical protein